MNFKNKVAVITGGASGIGAATAWALAREEANVVVCDINAQSLAKMQEEMKAAHHAFLGLEVDVANEKGVERLMQQAVSRFGGIDFLVNNAGIAAQKREGKKIKLWDMSIADWDRVMGVNIRGAFLCCYFAVPRMIERGGGAIVNISSIAVKIGSMVAGCPYVISKAGIVGLTKILAREAAEYGIRVNAVAPGRIDTPMIRTVPAEVNEAYKNSIPLKRLGEVGDIADGILYLLSEKASYITGVVLDINGGVGMFY